MSAVEGKIHSGIIRFCKPQKGCPELDRRYADLKEFSSVHMLPGWGGSRAAGLDCYFYACKDAPMRNRFTHMHPSVSAQWRPAPG